MSDEETAKNTDDLPHGLDGLRKLARDYDSDEKIGDGLLYVKYDDWGGEERVKKTTLFNELQRLADEIEDEPARARIDDGEPVNIGDVIYRRDDDSGDALIIDAIAYYQDSITSIRVLPSRRWVHPDELTRIRPPQRDRDGIALHFGDLVINNAQRLVYVGRNSVSGNADLLSEDRTEVTYDCHDLVHIYPHQK